MNALEVYNLIKDEIDCPSTRAVVELIAESLASNLSLDPKELAEIIPRSERTVRDYINFLRQAVLYAQVPDATYIKTAKRFQRLWDAYLAKIEKQRQQQQPPTAAEVFALEKLPDPTSPDEVFIDRLSKFFAHAAQQVSQFGPELRQIAQRITQLISSSHFPTFTIWQGRTFARINYTRDALRTLETLDKHERGQFLKALMLLSQNPTHPSLHTKRMTSEEGRVYSRASLRIRFAWHIDEEGDIPTLYITDVVVKRG